MPSTIRVQLLEEVSDDSVSRFRNFGEDVYRGLRGLATVSLEEIDSSTDQFHVRNVRTRDLGKVTLLLRRIIRRNKFEGTIDLVREDRVPD